MNLILTEKARRDLFTILSDSRIRFGETAQHRYRLLVEQAILDLVADPGRTGVSQPKGVAADIQVYHTRRSAIGVPKPDRVGRPRHLLAFRLSGDTVVVLRILHDAMDLPRNLKDE